MPADRIQPNGWGYPFRPFAAPHPIQESVTVVGKPVQQGIESDRNNDTNHAAKSPLTHCDASHDTSRLFVPVYPRSRHPRSSDHPLQGRMAVALHHVYATY